MEKRRNEIELTEALSLISKTDLLPGEETVPLERAHRKVLAKDIFAYIDQPPFDRSPLDGYALRSEDTVSASPQSPVRLSLAGKLCAGVYPNFSVQRNQAARIMTGAPIPHGCDCVIKQEETGSDQNQVIISRPLSRHENFCFRGEDFFSGSLLLSSGTKLDAAAIGVLASSNYVHVPVRRELKAALLVTGDELVEPGAEITLPPGKIFSSNLFMLCARLCELSVHVVSAAQTGDEAEIVGKVISKSLEQADVLFTTGGVSVGEKDILTEVLPALGAEQVFHGVNIKPGAPAMFSFLNGKPVLSLSGNPFAAAATFEILGRPLLAALSGDSTLLPVRALAKLSSPFGKRSTFRRFLRASLKNGEITLPEGHSSGQLRSLAGCNCLLVIPPDAAVSEGDIMEVYLL